MKNQWHNIIRLRLAKYRKECLYCLYPENDYTWGTTYDNLNKTLSLCNKILKDIPFEAWPKKETTTYVIDYVIASNNWSVKLSWDWDSKRRLADLRYKKDDHTAWVIEHSKKRGRFINYDIGGS